MGRGRSSGGRGSSSSGGRGRSSSSGRGSSSSSGFSVGGSKRTFSSGGSKYYESPENNNQTTYYKTQKTKQSYINKIFLAIFLLSWCVFLIISAFCKVVECNKYDITYGKCIKNEYGGGFYYTTYSYVVEEINYENKSLEGWELPETIGKTVKIFYLKDNPNQITEKIPNTYDAEFIFALFVGVCGVVVLITTIKQLKKYNLQLENYNKVILKQKVYCEYCKGLIKDGLDSCPNCGASIKENSLKKENNNEKN